MAPVLAPEPPVIVVVVDVVVAIVAVFCSGVGQRRLLPIPQGGGGQTRIIND